MSAALSIGARALTTNLTALQVIGHNIANANTVGYSRQSVNLQVAGYQQLGGQYYGQGVQVDTVTRAHDAYLTRESQLSSAVAAADSTRLQRLEQLENLFPTGENGLGAAVNDMLNAWSDVSSSPTNLSARVVVLGRGEEMASRLRETASQLDLLTQSAHQQVSDTVTKINRLATDIGKANQQIMEAQGDRNSPNDLLDQRDALVAELSKLLQVTTVPADDGSISVFAAGSQPLVLGTRAASLAVTRDSTDAAELNITFQQAGVSMDLPNSALGGALGGVMTFIEQDLKAMGNELGRMALVISETVNTQHRLGTDLAGNPGGNFFVPAPAITGLPAASNTGTAQITASVSDPTALQASDYELRFDGSNINVVRLSDGTSQSFGGWPAEFDGLSFDAPSGVAFAGDVYRVKPYAEVTRNMQMAVSSADRLAAASPVTITPDTANGGGISVESLYAVAESADLTSPVSFTFQSDGSFSITGLGAGNPPADNPGPPETYNYTPGTPLQFNGWSLTLRGTPTVGDTFTIGPSPAGSTQQSAGNANGMLALRDLATYDGLPLTDGYGSLLSNIGTRVQGAQFAANYSGQIATSAESARQSVAGVNLDEEAARLLQFQQAYQASAKFLQVAQSTFDTLLQTMG